MSRESIAEKLGYLTENQVAELAEIQVSTLIDWRRRGRGPASILFGSAYFYALEDIQVFMSSLKKTQNREHLLMNL